MQTNQGPWPWLYSLKNYLHSIFLMLAVNSKWFLNHMGQFVASRPSEAHPSVLDEGTEVEGGKGQ